MFLEGATSGYDDSGQQVARGPFLLICDDPTSNTKNLGAAVRDLSLTQLGHFMMGRIRLAGCSISVNGAYGNNGLPVHLEHKDLTREQVGKVWGSLVPVPAEIAKVFWAGEGGWNGAGSEADAMRQWAAENIEELRKTRVRKGKP